MDPNLAPVDIAARVAAVRAKAAITPAHLCDRFASAGAPSPVWTLELRRSSGRVEAAIDVPGTATSVARPFGVTARRPREEDVALSMFTSGTTSTPKVVPLTHANLAASIGGICATYRLAPDDATLLVMPLFHGHGLIAGLLSTLATGGAAHMPSGGRFSASTFWSEMTSVGATWYTAVPTIHQILLERAAAEYPKAHLPALRFIRSCSAPLTTTLLHQIESTFAAPVIEAYGMTETAHQATSNPLPTVGAHKPSSVGLPTGVEVRILAPDGRTVATRMVGEVCIRGAAVTSGYREAPDVNAATFVDGWFHTGDLGYLDEDGYLFLEGRIKEIINRGGEKISPRHVDVVLLSNPKVEDALSFGVPDEKYGEEIAAAIIIKPGQTTTEQELAQYSRERLSAFEVPKRFYFVTDFPRTAKGAPDRRKLAMVFARASRP
jgi:acyl-CoA synthetase (AMP-forming)/AMP-acid ligase II